MTPEVESLLAVLEAQRRAVLEKLAGVSEVDARRSTVASGTNLAGLVQHLTFVESKWFEHFVAGRSARGDRSMQVDLSVSLRTLRAAYRARVLKPATRSSVASATPMLRWLAQANQRHLRWALLAVIAETARHAGHADIIREQIDGRTGR